MPLRFVCRFVKHRIYLFPSILMKGLTAYPFRVPKRPYESFVDNFTFRGDDYDSPKIKKIYTNTAH